MTIRELRTLDDCRAVVKIQEEVWGKDGETVPASVLLVSAKSGGILLGAEVDAEFVGFVWSMPGIRDGRLMHWSHMTGVLASYRGRGVAMALKLAQRDRALGQGVELIEWTFDPLQAPNAHFNLHVLGAVGAKYGVDVYGSLAGPLHRGTPTDRLIVEWKLAEPHVVRRLEAHARRAGLLTARSAEVMEAPQIVHTREEGEWVGFAGANRRGPDLRRMFVAVPPRFSEMQVARPDLALEWRLGIRDVMRPLFDEGYRAVDFMLDAERLAGNYLFAK